MVTRKLNNPRLAPKMANAARDLAAGKGKTKPDSGRAKPAPTASSRGSDRERSSSPTPKKKGNGKGRGGRRRGEQQNVVAQTTSDLAAGQDLFKRFADFGDLPRVENRYAQQEADALARRNAFADPASASYAGRRSADVADILSRMKSGLEGYTAAENQAMREAMDREITTQLNTDVRNARDTNASNLVLGGAAIAREDALRRSAAQARAQNEQDIFIKNADEKRSRLDAYGKAVSGAESTEFGRGQEAIGAYENALGGVMSNDMGLQKENLEIEKDDRNAQVAGVTGFTDLINARRSRNDQKAMIDQYYKTR